MTNYKKTPVKTELFLQLNEQELRERADQISKKVKEINDINDEFSKARKFYGTKIKDLKSQLDTLTDAYSTKTEERNVDCYQVWDLDNKKTWFEYKGDKYHEKEMTNYEVKQVTQRRLFNDGPDLPGVEHVPNTEVTASV